MHYDKAIVSSLNTLKINERRIIWLVLAQIIDTKTILPENHYFYIKPSEYSSLCGLALDTARDILKGSTKFSFLDSIHYDDKKRYVKLILNKDILPYVSGLKTNYTTQKLSYSLRLQNSASALYAFLRIQISEGFTKSKIIDVKDLKESLLLHEGSYVYFNYFDISFQRIVKELILKTEFNKIKMKRVKKQGSYIVCVELQYEYSED